MLAFFVFTLKYQIIDNMGEKHSHAIGGSHRKDTEKVDR